MLVLHRGVVKAPAPAAAKGGREREREVEGTMQMIFFKKTKLCSDFLKVWTEQKNVKFSFTEERV